MSSIEIQETISQFIESQFPRHYREQESVELTESQRSLLIDFTEAYYEWIESQIDEGPLRSRKMFEYRDVDTTPQAFIEYFRKKYLADLTYTTVTDERFLIKNIIDLYRAKGSESSIKLLIRLLFNEDASVYFPGQDVLRVSDSLWVDPIYVEAISSENSTNLINKRVFGSKSGATAYVEDVITKRVQNRLIDILYLSNVLGTFVTGDIVTNDGVLANGVKVTGSFSDVTINVNTEGGNSIGDQFEIDSFYGVSGKVKVTSLKDQDGSVTFELVDGGFGYTTDDRTQIYISDLIVLRDNSNTIFEIDDTITQKVERIYLTDAGTFIGTANVGDTVYGYDSANNQIANAEILNITTETIGTTIFNAIDVQVDAITFLQNQLLTFTSDVDLIVGNQITEERDVSFVIDSANGSFANGETVYQRDLSDTSNNISDRYAFGTVVSANDTHLEITNAFGTFIEDDLILGYTSGAFANVANVTSESSYSNATIIDKVSNNQYRVVYSINPISANVSIREEGSKVIADVANTEDDSALTVRLQDGTEATVNSAANNYFSGIVIGQNTTAVGIASSTDKEFVYLSGSSKLINQNDDEMIVSNRALGSGASFEVGSIDNVEYVDLAVEKINSENIVGVNYPLIYINGTGSGIGYVESITVVDGGSGYSNSSTVTFSNGGYENQNPLIPAQGTVTTNSSGGIALITLTSAGEGYFETPTISVSDGSSANLQINMQFGYGFPEEIFANANTIIGDALDIANVAIGEISTLSNLSTGSRYTNKPFVRVLNSSIESFKKQDQTASVSLLTATQFTVGEIITQANTNAEGTVISYSSGTLQIRDTSFEENFTVDGGILTGAQSGATATINSIEINTSSDYMGDNANVASFVVEQAGVVNSIAIVDSGYGYINGETVTLTNANNTLTGTITVSQQGISPGYWKTRSSHLNSEKKIHDNNYYQEFSYDIQSPIDIEKYRNTVLELLHLSGTKLFGTNVRVSEQQITPTSESSITSI